MKKDKAVISSQGGGSKNFEDWEGRGWQKILGLGELPIWGGWCTFAGGSVPHYMPCLRHTAYNRLLPESRTSRNKIICNKKVYENQSC